MSLGEPFNETLQNLVLQVSLRRPPEAKAILPWEKTRPNTILDHLLSNNLFLWFCGGFRVLHWNHHVERSIDLGVEFFFGITEKEGGCK